MHPTTPCAVVYKFFTVFFFLQFLTIFLQFFFLRFFAVFYKAVEWAADSGAGDLGGLVNGPVWRCVPAGQYPVHCQTRAGPIGPGRCLMDRSFPYFLWYKTSTPKRRRFPIRLGCLSSAVQSCALILSWRLDGPQFVFHCKSTMLCIRLTCRWMSALITVPIALTRTHPVEQGASLGPAPRHPTFNRWRHPHVPRRYATAPTPRTTTAATHTQHRVAGPQPLSPGLPEAFLWARR